MARPTKYNADTAKKICDAIRIGATYKLACNFAGISEDTFALWRKKIPEFDTDVVQAEGAGAVGWLAKIEKAANDGTWQAAAWKLERRYPQQYGRQVIEQQHTGKDGGPIHVAIDRRAALAAIAPGPVRDSDAPGDGEGDYDGEALG